MPAGSSPLTCVVYPAGPNGPVGPCETSSLSFEEIREPLEYAVLSYADPAGQHAAVGTLSPSDCYPAGPMAPVVAGGPVGPCEMPSPSSEEIQAPLEHAVLTPADPAGQHAAVGTLSPSDCYPAGPAGPCVAGGPVGPDDYLQVLEPFEQLVLDHADPAGQHAVIQDTVDSLEHPRTLPDMTLDGGLVERISDWEPAASTVPDTTLDGRLMEGTTYLEHSALGVSLDSGLMEGMSSPEPLEQSVLNTLLVARPGGGIRKEISDWEPVAHPVPDTTLDGQLMEGTTYLEHSVLGVSLDSGLMEGMSSLEPLEQSVLNKLSATRPERRNHGGALRPGTGGASGSRHYPGRSTYGGDYLPGAFGSGCVSRQWTHGGDVASGTIRAVGS